MADLRTEVDSNTNISNQQVSNSDLNFNAENEELNLNNLNNNIESPKVVVGDKSSIAFDIQNHSIHSKDDITDENFLSDVKDVSEDHDAQIIKPTNNFKSIQSGKQDSNDWQKELTMANLKKKVDENRKNLMTKNNNDFTNPQFKTTQQPITNVNINFNNYNNYGNVGNFGYNSNAFGGGRNFARLLIDDRFNVNEYNLSSNMNPSGQNNLNFQSYHNQGLKGLMVMDKERNLKNKIKDILGNIDNKETNEDINNLMKSDFFNTGNNYGSIAATGIGTIANKTSSKKEFISIVDNKKSLRDKQVTYAATGLSPLNSLNSVKSSSKLGAFQNHKTEQQFYQTQPDLLQLQNSNQTPLIQTHAAISPVISNIGINQGSQISDRDRQISPPTQELKTEAVFQALQANTGTKENNPLKNSTSILNQFKQEQQQREKTKENDYFYEIFSNLKKQNNLKNFSEKVYKFSSAKTLSGLFDRDRGNTNSRFGMGVNSGIPSNASLNFSNSRTLINHLPHSEKVNSKLEKNSNNFKIIEDKLNKLNKDKLKTKLDTKLSVNFESILNSSTNEVLKQNKERKEYIAKEIKNLTLLSDFSKTKKVEKSKEGKFSEILRTDHNNEIYNKERGFNLGRTEFKNLDKSPKIEKIELIEKLEDSFNINLNESPIKHLHEDAHGEIDLDVNLSHDSK